MISYKHLHEQHPGRTICLLISKEESSAKYGPCEVCGKPVGNVYHMVILEPYSVSDHGVMLEGHTITTLDHEFGHKDCLLESPLVSENAVIIEC